MCASSCATNPCPTHLTSGPTQYSLTRCQCHTNLVALAPCTPADDDVRLARRIQRDVQDRGRDVTGVLEQYQRFVKPAFDNFVAPSRR